MSGLEQLREEIKNCQRCHLYKGCPSGCTPVPGIGNEDAKIMFTAEAPGQQESKQIEPLVGMAGQLFDKMLNNAGIPRDSVYLSNCVNCRPTRQVKNRICNRPPTSYEVDRCKIWLWKQFKLISPEVVVTLGNFPSSIFLKRPLSQTKVTQIMGDKFHIDYNGKVQTTVVPCYHPSYCLRRGQKEVNECVELFKDVKALVEGESSKCPF